MFNMSKYVDIQIRTSYGDISLRMKNILNKINRWDKFSQGSALLAGYTEEVWRKLVTKEKYCKKYEKSDDMVCMAIAMAYRKKLNCYILEDKEVETFFPKTPAGIRVWNNVLFSCRNGEQVVSEEIERCLIGEDVKQRFMDGLMGDAEDQYYEDMANMDFEEFYSNDKKSSDTKSSNVDAEEVTSEEFKAAQRGDMQLLKRPDVVDAEKVEDVVDDNKNVKKNDKNTEKQPAKDSGKESKKPKSMADVLKSKVSENDPVKTEHPEDDIPDISKSEESTPFEEDIKKSAYELNKFHDFGDVMKDLIHFDNDADQKNTYATQRIENQFMENNVQFEQVYPKIAPFTALLNKNGYAVEYRFFEIPAGKLIHAYVVTMATNASMLLFIDPNVIYKNGYNVLTSTSGRGKLLTEAFIPISDEENVLLFARKRLNQKERRAITKKYPAATKTVFELIDFSGLGKREALDNNEWTSLVNNLGDLIKEENLQFRATIGEYKSPDKFRLYSSNATIPFSNLEEDIAIIRMDGTTFWVDYDIQKYGEKKYACGTNDVAVG